MIIPRFEHAGIDRLINRLEQKSADLHTPLSAAGEIMLTSIDRNFEAQGRFSSAGELRGGTTRWKPLAAATVKSRLGRSRGKRRAQRMSSMRILQASNQASLRDSFSKKVSGNTLVVGSNRIDAAKHNYGGYGGRGRQVYEPARPILVVQDEDVEDMLNLLGRHLNG